MFLFTTKEVLDAIWKIYSKVKDAAQIYDLNVNMWSTKQENRSFIEYSNMSKGWWQEFGQYQSRVMDCSKDTTHLKQFVDKDSSLSVFGRTLLGLDLYMYFTGTVNSKIKLI